MNLEDHAGAGFDAMVAVAGKTLKIGLNTYDCVPDDDEFSKALEEGGFLEERSFNVHVRKSDFTTIPEPLQIVEIEDQEWRVLEVITSPGDPCIRLRCGSKER